MIQITYTEKESDQEIFEGSSDPSHFIFQISVEKSRIRHTTFQK